MQGFFVYSRVKKYRSRGKGDPWKPKASLSFSHPAPVAYSYSPPPGATAGSVKGPDDRETKRRTGASALSYSAAGASSSPRGAAAGGAKEGRDDRGVRRPRSFDLPRESKTMSVQRPQTQPQTRSSQQRGSSGIDEEPRFRFVAHPYQINAQDSSTSLPADSEAFQQQANELPPALALPVSSHAGGDQPPPSPPLSGKSLYSQSSFTHVKLDNGVKSEDTAASSSRRPGMEPKRITSNPTPLERKFSKSFLDIETQSTSTDHCVQNLPRCQQTPATLFLSPAVLFRSPAALFESPALASSNGHTPNPNTRINANKEDKEGKTTSRLMMVDASYTPLLSDELPLKLGDVVRLLHEFDDGWCIVERNGTTGAVPNVCLKEWAQT